MIENVSTQLTVFHCLCPLPASRKGLRLTLRSALFGEGGRDWRPCIWVFVESWPLKLYQLTPDRGGHFLPQGHNLNELGRSPVNDAYIPNINALSLAVSDKIFHIFPI